MIRNAIVTLSALGLLAVGVTACEVPEESSASSKQATDPKAAKKEAKKRAKKAIAVKAADIIAEFEANEAAADAKYKGKTLKVTGIVGGVDTEFMDEDEYIIQIGGGSEYEFLFVNADDQPQSVVSKYQPGDKITVVGEFEDGGDLGVELANSQVVK